MTTQTEFKPTAEMLNKGMAVFVAMAKVETIKPIVRGYQKAILIDMHAMNDKYWRQNGDKPYIIMEPDHSYLLSQKDTHQYFKRCDEEKFKAGFLNTKKGYCPLLVAEHELMLAQSDLIEVMEPVCHITKDMIFSAPNALENYRKLVDLNLNLLAPYVSEVV